MATKRKRVTAVLPPPVERAPVPSADDTQATPVPRESLIVPSRTRRTRASGDGRKKRHRIPEADVRWLFETLLQGVEDPRLQRLVEEFGKLSEKKGLLQELRQSEDAPKLLTAAIKALSGNPEERTLAYPFTKGITTINEGMGFGELLEVKVGKVEGDKLKLYTVTSLRTRTGKLRLEPSSSSEPPHLASLRTKR